MRIRKWLVYTVMLALAPVLMRLLVLATVADSSVVSWLSETDVLAFGLTLAITNISGLESDERSDRAWKSQQIGLSLLNVAMFAALIAVTVLSEIAPSSIARGRLLAISVAMSAACALHSYSIWQRLSVLRPEGD